MEGGVLTLRGNSVLVGDAGTATVSGYTRGGVLTIEAPTGSISVRGQVLAGGRNGQGGVLTVQGASVAVSEDARLDVSGYTQGGELTIEAPDGLISLAGQVLGAGAALAESMTRSVTPLPSPRLRPRWPGNLTPPAAST